MKIRSSAYSFYTLLFLLLVFSACNQANRTAGIVIKEDTRIVSLNGAVTENLCLLGFEKNIVGVDVTSTAPQSMHRLPKVGHTRQIQAEAILSLHPDIVFGLAKEIKPELRHQIESTGAKLILFDLDYSAEGVKQLTQKIADTTGIPEKAAAIVNKFNEDMAKVEKLPVQPKVLFIYARGAGSLMVAGQSTMIDKVIGYAGGINAAQGFTEFKALTPESLVEFNPDAVLLFSSGYESLQGESGLLASPGMMQTNAGKHKAFIHMDGHFIGGTGPETGAAVYELNQKLKALLK